MERLKRLDDGLARGEAAIAAFVLLVMIALAAIQAILYNVATSLGQQWANDLLLQMDWIDAILQKGTLWLAFIGASLATHDDKHIAIDALSRVLPGRIKVAIKAFVSVAAGVTCFYLARVFYTAAMRPATERPLEYEILADSGPVHICEASLQSIEAIEMSRPSVFCAARWTLGQIGVPAETPVGALNYIVPVMFLVIAVRFVARGVGRAMALSRGEGAGSPSVAKRIEHRDEAKHKKTDPDDDPDFERRETKKMEARADAPEPKRKKKRSSKKKKRKR